MNKRLTNKIVSINSRKFNKSRFLGTLNNYARDSEFISDDLIFFTGVALSTVLPEGIYSADGGLAPLTAFVGCAVTGVICGLIKYYTAPDQIIPRIGTGTGTQAPPSEDTTLKAA